MPAFGIGCTDPKNKQTNKHVNVRNPAYPKLLKMRINLENSHLLNLKQTTELQ